MKITTPGFEQVAPLHLPVKPYGLCLRAWTPGRHEDGLNFHVSVQLESIRVLQACRTLREGHRICRWVLPRNVFTMFPGKTACALASLQRKPRSQVAVDSPLSSA
jgi:hypothetical protein